MADLRPALILCRALVLALTGVGSSLTIEAPRHFREADSAEDVKLSLAALEPFTPAGDDERTEARRGLGDTVLTNYARGADATSNAFKLGAAG